MKISYLKKITINVNYRLINYVLSVPKLLMFKKYETEKK